MNHVINIVFGAYVTSLVEKMWRWLSFIYQPNSSCFWCYNINPGSKWVKTYQSLDKSRYKCNVRRTNEWFARCDGDKIHTSPKFTLFCGRLEAFLYVYLMLNWEYQFNLQLDIICSYILTITPSCPQKQGKFRRWDTHSHLPTHNAPFVP